MNRSKTSRWRSAGAGGFGLSQTSIRTQITVVAATCCLAALTLSSIGSILVTSRTMRQSLFLRVENLADLVAFNSGAVVSFAQGDAAEGLLATLRSQRMVERAVLYDFDGDVLAQYVKAGGDRNGAKSFADPPPIESMIEYQTSIGDAGLVRHFRPVEENGDTVGYLMVEANRDHWWQTCVHTAWITLLLAVVGVGAATATASRLEGWVSRPIVAMARLAGRVREDQDYSVRWKSDRGGEIGSLGESFNAMLASIAESKEALRKANDHLEDRVAQRTADLEAEIAGRERTAQALIRAKEDAEAANQSKSDFLANMSHEIRTPMNAVLGFTDLLRRGAYENEAEHADYLDTIAQSGSHLLTLINDILDLSKIEAGQLQVELRETSPHKIISEAISVMRVRAHQKNLTLDYSWAGPMPARMKTDEARLRQLLLNLVGNAIKFTKEGGVQVVAELIHDDTGDVASEPRIKIDVIDTGVGIATDKLRSIFDPFAQADTSVTRKFGGTGLGLTISRRIAEALGGGLEVTSEVGRGSIFTATVAVGWVGPIPMAASIPARPHGDIVPSDVPMTDGASPNIRDANILLVEDGETNRRMIGLMLRGHQVRITMVGDGAQAIEACEQEAFDVILMDMQMPVMDGYTATEVLRERGMTVPIIALTAHAMKGDEQKCLDAGCSGYLTKPIAEDRLVQTLSEHLQGTTALQPQKLTRQGPTGSSDGGVRQPSLSTSTGSMSGNNGPVLNDSEPPFPPSEDLIRSCYPSDDEDYREIISDFMDQMKTKSKRMRSLVATGQYEDLRFEAHWLKGTAGTAGFDQFTVPAIRLRRSLETRDPETIEASLDIIVDMVDRMTLE